MRHLPGFGLPLLLKGRTRTTTLMLPPPPGAIFGLYPIHKGVVNDRLGAGNPKRVTGGDRSTPVRKLRKERDLWRFRSSVGLK